jgi:hypothetical protein
LVLHFHFPVEDTEVRQHIFEMLLGSGGDGVQASGLEHSHAVVTMMVGHLRKMSVQERAGRVGRRQIGSEL